MTEESTSENINLLELLSTLADACARGCQVILAVNKKRQEQKKDPSKDEAINVQYKVADDPRSALTEADLNSQLVIMECIRSVYGSSLNIIGEEDGDEADETTANFGKYNVDPISKRGMNKSLFNKSLEEGFSLSKMSVPSKDVTVYIDPMDGTREFVEERLQNVQCLIGITLKGKPVGGVIGLPFVNFDESESDDSNNITCSMNVNECNIIEMIRVQNGVCQSDSERQNTWQSLEKINEEDDFDLKSTIKIFTGDSSRIQMKHALKFLEDRAKENGDTLKRSIAGGCGNKILRTTAYPTVNSGIGNAISIINPGTCSWDTAAPSSILFASMKKFGVKGKVTDMFGGELVYNSSGATVENNLGAFVSCGEKAVEYHEKLVAAMRADKIVLDSLLHKYWDNFGDDCTSAGVDKDEDQTRMKLTNAQAQAQNVHIIRNTEGYVMKCEEIQTLVSNQMNVKGSQLIGYAMPSKESNMLQLFWRKNEDGRNELPDTVTVHKTISTLSLKL